MLILPSYLRASPAVAGGGSYTPVWNQNFNSFSNGQSLNSGAAFTSDAGRTVADTSVRYGGSGASAKMSIRTTDGGGFGNWGGIKNISPFLHEGDEIWVRWRQYWPSAFQFTASPFMKFFRIHTRPSGSGSGGNTGYNDLYIDDANGGGNAYRVTFEGFNSGAGDVDWELWDSNAIPRDQWITYEMYVKFDDVSVVNGGQGRIRVWVDGVLGLERTNTRTMATGDECDRVHWFTYWNNETPPNNDCYCDDIVIATSASPPTNTDSGGRPFIGV